MSKPKTSVTSKTDSTSTPVLPPCSVPYRYILHVGRWVSVYFDKTQPSALWTEHSHTKVQILFFGTGAQCTIHWEEAGEWRCEEVKGPNLWIIGVGVPHKLEWHCAALRLVFYIEPEFVGESDGLEITETALFTLDGASRCDAKIPVFLGEFEGLEQPTNRRELVHLESLSALASVHILQAWRCLTNNFQDWRSRMSSRDLARIAQMIERRMGEKLLISEMAREVNMSESNFARVFTRSVGTAPGQHLINLRIEKAKELLISTDHRIGEIALLVGFSSQGHFDVFFKRKVGITPSEYRFLQRR